MSPGQWFVHVADVAGNPPMFHSEGYETRKEALDAARDALAKTGVSIDRSPTGHGLAAYDRQNQWCGYVHLEIDRRADK